MTRYSPLPQSLLEQLNSIAPSRSGEMLYFPCAVLLRSGQTLDTVYVEPDQMYFDQWGVYPEDDKYKNSILIDDVVKIQESPLRLPVQFANLVYEGGESGMGAYVFTLLFEDGSRQAYYSGSAIDFIPYPAGKGAKDIVGVMPHEGRGDPSAIGCLDWHWCLYSGRVAHPSPFKLFPNHKSG
jgi:hypothetical protein